MKLIDHWFSIFVLYMTSDQRKFNLLLSTKNSLKRTYILKLRVFKYDFFHDVQELFQYLESKNEEPTMQLTWHA